PNTHDYIFPAAPVNEPLCFGCIDPGDTRISGTPVYAHGRIYAAWETELLNPNDLSIDNAIIWAEGRVEMTEVGCAFATDIWDALTTAGAEMGYYFFFNCFCGLFAFGDLTPYYGALMPDAEGNLCMVYGRSSSVEFRSVYYTCRRATFHSSLFRDPGRLLKAGTVSMGVLGFKFRGGRYEASSYDGLLSSPPPLPADHPWFCGQYATMVLGDPNWSTWCVRVNFQLRYG